MPDQRHGHVVPRPDGFLARCGGPSLCPDCAAEARACGVPAAEPCHRATQPPRYLCLPGRDNRPVILPAWLADTILSIAHHQVDHRWTAWHRSGDDIRPPAALVTDCENVCHLREILGALN